MQELLQKHPGKTQSHKPGSLWDNHSRSINGISLNCRQSLVHPIKRENRGPGTQIDFAGKLKKITGIGARHVRDTAQLALAPEKAIIVEFRNAVEMDRVDGDNAAFAQAGQGGYHYISAGREGD